MVLGSSEYGIKESKVETPTSSIRAVSWREKSVFSGHSVIEKIDGFIAETPCEFQCREYGTQIELASVTKE